MARGDVIRILAVGDALLTADTMREIIAPYLPPGVTLDTVQWETDGREELQRLNHTLETKGPAAVEPPAGLVEKVPEADVLFVQFCPVSEAVMATAPRLRLIAVGRSGVQNVDVAAASARGIPVLNTVGRNAEAVAEYTIGLLLCEARNIARAHAALKRGEWRKKYANDETVPELPGRTLGIVGFGQIGRLLVQRLQGFEMEFLTYDPYVEQESIADLGVRAVTLRELMRESDFVTLHARLTEETRHLIDREMLELMKPTAYLINTARAEIVDEGALVDCLRHGRIAGAALDVFTEEPVPTGAPVLELDNVTLSPHQAGITADAYRTTARLFAQNVSRLWKPGQMPANVVNQDTRDNLEEFKQFVEAQI